MATHTMSDAIFFFKSEVHTKSLVQEYPTVKAWPDIILEQRKWSEKMTKVNTQVPGCLALVVGSSLQLHNIEPTVCKHHYLNSGWNRQMSPYPHHV